MTTAVHRAQEAPVSADEGDPRELGVEAIGISKHFRDGADVVKAVDDVTLRVPRGEFWVLLGPSGCGKTTLLRSLAGLETPTAGRIAVDGRTVFEAGSVNVDPQHREIGMVFQTYALWPHMTVAENVAYPLTTRRSQRRDRAGVRQRVKDVLGIMGMETLGERAINRLSGGQQQRVALARAIVAGNDLVLFDEPLSNIDAKVREQLRFELSSMQRQLGFTAVYVTHDQAEAMELADRIAVMREGRIEQLGTSRQIYRRPTSRYVADFIGTATALPGKVVELRGDHVLGRTAIGDVQATVGTFGVAVGDQVAVTTRAHDWTILQPGHGESSAQTWDAVVTRVTYLGTHTEYVVECGGTRLRIWRDDEESLREGATVRVSVRPEVCTVLRDD